MLAKLVVKNFQKHHKLTLNISSAITVILGPTDQGKSSILRALRWVMMNQPSGTEFITRPMGTKTCRVKIITALGSVVSRIRSKSRNEYIVDGKKLKAFGSGVPKQVDEIINVTEDNFQDQLDPPYWFGLAAGQISKNLNEIVDLSAVDNSFAYLNAEHRKVSAEVSVVKDRLTEARAERKRLRIAVRMDEDLRGIESLRKKAKRARERAEHLETIVGHALESLRISRMISRSSQKLDRILSDVGAIAERIEKIQGERDLLAELISTVQELEYDRGSAVESLNEVEKKLAKFKVCPICQNKLPKQS
jgi:exonuclease SbcC